MELKYISWSSFSSGPFGVRLRLSRKSPPHPSLQTLSKTYNVYKQLHFSMQGMRTALKALWLCNLLPFHFTALPLLPLLQHS